LEHVDAALVGWPEMVDLHWPIEADLLGVLLLRGVRRRRARRRAVGLRREPAGDRGKEQGREAELGDVFHIWFLRSSRRLVHLRLTGSKVRAVGNGSVREEPEKSAEITVFLSGKTLRSSAFGGATANRAGASGAKGLRR